VNYAVGTDPSSVAAADFNGDGLLDLVASSSGHSFSVLMNTGAGLFAAATAVSELTTSYVAVADFNGDGNQDIVLITPITSGVVVRLGNGDGTFGGPLRFGANTAPFALATGLFSTGGDPGILVLNYGANSVSALANRTP